MDRLASVIHFWKTAADVLHWTRALHRTLSVFTSVLSARIKAILHSRESWPVFSVEMSQQATRNFTDIQKVWVATFREIYYRKSGQACNYSTLFKQEEQLIVMTVIIISAQPTPTEMTTNV